MRKTLILLTIQLCAVYFLSAQTNAELTGTWSIDHSQTIAVMSSAKKAQYDSLGADVKNQIKSQLESQSFSFDENGNFSVNISGQTSYTGTYSLDGSNLILTYSQGSQVTQVIEQLQGSTMTLRIINDPNNAALIHRIFLRK